jgi:hypothetical protein
MNPAALGIKLKIETPDLLAGSEKIGFAVNECHGVLEQWSVGVLGLVEVDLFLHEWYKAKNKNRPPSAFDLLYSITPPLHHSMGFQTTKTTPGEIKARASGS